MFSRYLPLVPVALCVSLAADRQTPATARAENAQVEITATTYLDKEAVKQLVGSDLGGSIAILEVRIAPKSGQGLAVSRDDFTLKSFKDGQKSQPFAPSQIAGQGALVVSTTSTGGGLMGDNNGPVWGGPMGQPGRLGGDGGSMGNASETAAQATVQTGGKIRPNPLLDTLKKKVLPEKETSAPVAGLLYFLLEGKHKPKDLELVYGGPAGKLSLKFK